MSLDPEIRNALTIPAICAPMFLVTGPDLVREACKAGLVGGMPRQNARSFELWEEWMRSIHEDLKAYREQHPAARIGPVAVNLSGRMPDIAEHLAVCRRYGVRIIISANSDPAETVRVVHDWGGLVYHDVTTMRFAEKAIAAGADGLTCIGAGGGGHSGTLSHLAFVPKVRQMFDGTIIMAGAISTGATIRAAEILGADLAYLGTRFIATQESSGRDEYKELLVTQMAKDVMYTGAIAGLPANWMIESMRRVGLDPANLPTPIGRGADHLPEGAKPWKTLWSAGQGIELIDDVPTVAELVRRLRAEYSAACSIPSMAESASLVDEAMTYAPTGG
jgi:nitronate monooxygenase